MKSVKPEIIEYVEDHIIPQYVNFDKAHRRDHVQMVIKHSLALAKNVPDADIDMVYCIAAFHDLGLANGRERHHIDSAVILGNDSFILNNFTPGQIEVMKQAVEDHRASGKEKPRSIYGMIVADADRFIDAETIIRRTIQYGLANYPDLDREGHYGRTLQHLAVKYGPDGYLRVWLPCSDNAARLERLRTIIADEDRLKEIFNRLYAEETDVTES